MPPHVSNSYNQFWQQESCPKRYEEMSQSKYTPNSQCCHHLRILQLRQRIKQLQHTDQELQLENDKIIKAMDSTSQDEKRREEQSLMWQKKYQKLKHQNDKKAQKLHALNGSGLGDINMNKPRQPFQSIDKQIFRKAQKRQIIAQKYFQDGKQPKVLTERERTERRERPRQKTTNFDQMLTKEQKQYVRQLQEGRKLRSNSMKSFNGRQIMANEGKVYSTKLSDGITIHIIDSREKHHKSVRC